MDTIDTDYLVVGAGASAMAFVDALITDSDADVVLVDRRHRPGGHWNDAYPFVRLHQPSAYYGINSLQLGHDRIDDTGVNAGFYERSTAAEICTYFERALTDRLLPSGQVQFLGRTDYVGETGNGHSVASLLTGAETTVRVRRKLVDATFLESEIPSRHTPSFEIDDGVCLIPPNDLVSPDAWHGTPSGFTVLGSGKTSMDTCTWLLDSGVPADRIRWIKPRESWMYERSLLQPLDLVASVIEGVALDVESAAEAEDVDDLFRRLEDCGRLVRVDREVEPTMFCAATISLPEIDALRTIDHVVRKGRVLRLGRDEIVLDGGSIPTDPGQVHVDCTARGLPTRSPVPIFESDRITLQTMRIGLTPFNAALIGYIEATRHDDAEKNRLCPPNVYPNAATDWIPTNHVSTRAGALWTAEQDVADWLERSRLSITCGMQQHFGEPRMQSALTRLLQHQEAALANMERMLAPA
jgi:hypothetical protein